MPLEKTNAVVLKSFPYGDTSKIARCYTRQFGKISVIGKGVRKGKTLRSGYLEPLNYLALLFYRNPKRQLQIFSKAEFRAIWLPLKKDVKKTSYGFAVLEIVDKAVTGEEPHQALFDLLVETLQAINDSEGKLNVLFWYFELQLLCLLGFRPNLSNCPQCHEDMEEGFFSGQYGELLCKRCQGTSEYSVSPRSIGILKGLKRARLDDLKEIALERGDRKQVGGFLNDYLRYHIEGLRELKSLKVMEQVLA